MAPPLNIDVNLKAARKEIMQELYNCSRRGLTKTVKWLAELNYSLSIDNNGQLDEVVHAEISTHHFAVGWDRYLLCKAYFDNGEYLRCAFFAEEFTHSCFELRFLRFYALFLDLEKKRLESMTEVTVVSDPKQTERLTELGHEIMASYKEGMDPIHYNAYDLYLLGMISRRVGDTDRAIDFLVGSIRQKRCIWGAYVELSFLIMDRKHLFAILKALELWAGWMFHFFCGHLYLELHMNEKALRTFSALQEAGFQHSGFIKGQIAIAYHNVQRVDEAIECFDKLSLEDPYRLDDMDLYSNMLYVKGEKYYLQVLANKAIEIDKFRVETSCIIGNLHSLKREHQKAITYFERALRINPYYLSAWTLMGHEYMEMKNANAAIQCYREAVEVNQHDYRAWNGLGQTYDILKMHAYSMFYYKKAHNLRPNDSRLLTALGEAYEKLDKTKCAKRCYERARRLGDIEGLAVLKLAKMHKMIDPDKAADAYLEYLHDLQANGLSDRDEEGKAHLFLANYNLDKMDTEVASKHAFKCLEYPEVKDEAKVLLAKLAKVKVKIEVESDADDSVVGEETNSTHNFSLEMDISGNRSEDTTPHNLNADDAPLTEIVD